MNNLENKSKDLNSNNEENFNFLGLFSNGDHFVYTFKKTEKIVQAIYAITSHFDPDEPLKLRMREQSLSFLSDALALNSEHSQESILLTHSFFVGAFEISSLIKTAQVSGMISSNNSSILEREINSLTEFLKDRIISTTASKGLILSKDFFATDVPAQAHSDKGQNSRSVSTNVSKNTEKSNQNNINLKDKRNSRQIDILELLKKQGHLTIKDFAKVIQGCSEKTIQRELIDLVEKGIVVREGERRWSRYSLKQ